MRNSLAALLNLIPSTLSFGNGDLYHAEMGLKLNQVKTVLCSYPEALGLVEANTLKL
jgi:hypothetical protein